MGWDDALSVLLSGVQGGADYLSTDLQKKQALALAEQKKKEEFGMDLVKSLAGGTLKPKSPLSLEQILSVFGDNLPQDAQSKFSLLKPKVGAPGVRRTPIFGAPSVPAKPSNGVQITIK